MRRFTVHLASPPNFIARMLLALVLCVGLLPFQAIASPGPDDIVVVDVKGDVRFTVGGASRKVQAGSTLALPAAIRTGGDGSVDLRQGETTIGVGPDTQLELPAPAQHGNQIGRVVQPLGNAFYSVAPRGSNRLRVETPYLVAVIKGTQFNVAVEQDTSTISLFEGRLEVLAPDINAAVELNAGEVAIRHRGDEEIRVIQMKDRATPSAQSKNGGGTPATTGLADSGSADHGPAVPQVATPLDNEVEILIDGSGPGAANLPVDAGINVGVSVGIDDSTGVQVGVDAGIDVGSVGVDAGVDASIDLGAGTVDASLDAGADLGPVSADLGVDAAVDAGAGSIDAGVDVGLLGTDLGVDIGADLAGSDAGLDLGIDLLGTEIDLGLGGGSTSSDTGSAPESGGLGGLLGGLLRPRGQ
jgi:FecR-like protein